jgi:hypothetical protein
MANVRILPISQIHQSSNLPVIHQSEMLEYIAQILALLGALWFFFLRGEAPKIPSETTTTTITERLDSTSIVQHDTGVSPSPSPQKPIQNVPQPIKKEVIPIESKPAPSVGPKQDVTPSNPSPNPSPKIVVEKKEEKPVIQENKSKSEIPTITVPVSIPVSIPQPKPIEKPVKKSIDIEISQNPENYMDQRIKSRSVLQPDVKGKRSSFQGKRSSTKQDISEILKGLVSENSLDAPNSSDFKDLCDLTKIEEFQKATMAGRKSQLREYGKDTEDVQPIVQGRGPPMIPPPMPTSQQLSTGSSAPDGKIKANDLLAMKDLLKKTKK